MVSAMWSELLKPPDPELDASRRIRIKAMDVETKGTSTDDLPAHTDWMQEYTKRRTDETATPGSHVEHPLREHIDDSDEVSMTDSVMSFSSRPRTGLRLLSDNDNLKQNISNSENPIFELFLTYGPVISDTWKMKLLRAAAFEAAIRAPKVISRVFEVVNNEIRTLLGSSMRGVNDIAMCEKTAKQLVSLKQAGHHKNKIYKGAIVEFYKLIGELQARSVWIEFRLAEYRQLFENLSMVDSQISLLECQEFETCYQTFLMCQGEAIELNNRILALKEACVHFQLSDIGLSSMPEALQPLLSEASISNASMMSSTVMSEGVHRTDADSKKLFEELQAAREEVDDLKTELFQAEQRTDRTPGKEECANSQILHRKVLSIVPKIFDNRQALCCFSPPSTTHRPFHQCRACCMN